MVELWVVKLGVKFTFGAGGPSTAPDFCGVTVPSKYPLVTISTQSIDLVKMARSTTSNERTIQELEDTQSMPGRCIDSDKHGAINASLQHVLQTLGLDNAKLLFLGIIDTESFLQPWTVYRDNYLLHPKFNKEGLCRGGEKMDGLFEHIFREINGRSLRTYRLSKNAGGRSHTIRLYSSLVSSLTTSGGFYDCGPLGDREWLRQICAELYVLVKHLRVEYVHGHGMLIDVIENKYPSAWLKEGWGEATESEQDDDKSIPESCISEYLQDVANIEADCAERLEDEDDASVYYKGFTDDESSEEGTDEEEDMNGKTNAHFASLGTRQLLSSKRD